MFIVDPTAPPQPNDLPILAPGQTFPTRLVPKHVVWMQASILDVYHGGFKRPSPATVRFVLILLALART